MSTLEMEKQPAGYTLKASLIILLPSFLIDEIELAVKMVSDHPLSNPVYGPVYMEVRDPR